MRITAFSEKTPREKYEDIDNAAQRNWNRGREVWIDLVVRSS